MVVEIYNGIDAEKPVDIILILGGGNLEKYGKWVEEDYEK